MTHELSKARLLEEVQRMRTAACRIRCATGILGPTIKNVSAHMDGATAFNCWDRITELEAMSDDLMRAGNQLYDDSHLGGSADG